MLLPIPYVAFGAESSLRIAACSDGLVPYVKPLANGTAVGYDIGEISLQ